MTLPGGGGGRTGVKKEKYVCKNLESPVASNALGRINYYMQRKLATFVHRLLLIPILDIYNIYNNYYYIHRSLF